MRIANVETKVAKIEVRARVVEEALCEAKDWAFSYEGGGSGSEVLASKTVTEVVEAFKAREENHLKILEANRNAF